MDKFVIGNKQNTTQKEMLIKSYLRSTMSQERLSRFTILSIENEILEGLDYKILINQFASQKAIKIDFK